MQGAPAQRAHASGMGIRTRRHVDAHPRDDHWTAQDSHEGHLADTADTGARGTTAGPAPSEPELERIADRWDRPRTLRHYLKVRDPERVEPEKTGHEQDQHVQRSPIGLADKGQ